MAKNPTIFSGVLVECEPSVKAIILKFDSEENAYIVEDLDEKHLVIKETMLADLKRKLKEVSSSRHQKEEKMEWH
jgi:TFIIH basal transcription factor complex TTD-A subunit